MITVYTMPNNSEYIGSDPAIIAKAVKTEIREDIVDPFVKQIQKARDLRAITNELEKGFVFDGNTYAMDDTSMFQYAMVKSLEQTDPKEPISISDAYYNKVYLTSIKYFDLCNQIGRKYKELIDAYYARDKIE